MRPLMVVNGILLGSCVSIAVSLALILIVYLFIGDEYPRVQHEFRPLLHSLLIFVTLTALTAGSFYALAIEHRLRFWAQFAMWVSLLAAGWYYWP